MGRNIGVLSVEGKYRQIFISPDKILPFMKQAPFCEALVIEKDKTNRRCCRKSRQTSEGQVRCFDHIDTDKFVKYKACEKNV